MDRYLIVRLSDGHVVNIAIGLPSVDADHETVLLEEVSGSVGIGWTRQPNGEFADTSQTYRPAD